MTAAAGLRCGTCGMVCSSTCDDAGGVEFGAHACHTSGCRGRLVHAPRPRIVVLCGSSRFAAQFHRANHEETMAGRIVLSIGFFRPSVESESEVERHAGTHGETWGCTPAQKAALDELHKRKIDMADEVLVLNVGGYIGESTRGEIEYARALGRPIRWLEPPIEEVAVAAEAS